MVQNIEKGLSPNFFYKINQNGLSPIFVFVVIFNIYYLKLGFFMKKAEEYITLHGLTQPTIYLHIFSNKMDLGLFDY